MRSWRWRHHNDTSNVPVVVIIIMVAVDMFDVSVRNAADGCFVGGSMMPGL